MTIMEQNFVDLNSPVVTPPQPSPASHVPPPGAPVVAPAAVSASAVTASPSATRRAPPRPPPPVIAPIAAKAVVDEANLLNLSLDDSTSPPVAPVRRDKSDTDALVELLTPAQEPATGSTSTPLSSVSSPLKPTSVAAPIPRPASSSSLNGTAATAFSAPKQPHYARSFFSDLESKPAASASAGVNPKVTPDHFEDLLQGFTKTANNANTKLAELKKQELLDNGSLDPVSLKVREWKENKTSNVRALIGSLHTVIWPECKVRE